MIATIYYCMNLETPSPSLYNNVNKSTESDRDVCLTDRAKYFLFNSTHSRLAISLLPFSSIKDRWLYDYHHVANRIFFIFILPYHSLCVQCVVRGSHSAWIKWFWLNLHKFTFCFVSEILPADFLSLVLKRVEGWLIKAICRFASLSYFFFRDNSTLANNDATSSWHIHRISSLSSYKLSSLCL